MLELRAVSYRYPGHARWVLEAVDLRIDDGEIVGLVGPNEAGKSTLCLVAAGLAPAAIGGELRGELVIDGEPMAGRPAHELAGRVAIAFEEPAASRSGVAGTVFEEVALGPQDLGLSVGATVERTRAALAAVGIGELTLRDPAHLSGGQAQLVSIGAAIAMGSRHLILDEPTARLDPDGTRRVSDALRRIAASGVGMLVAEGRLAILDGLCTRVIALDGGRVVLDGPAADVLADPLLATIGVALASPGSRTGGAG